MTRIAVKILPVAFAAWLLAPLTLAGEGEIPRTPQQAVPSGGLQARPGDGGEPLGVTVGVYLIDLFRITDVEQTFSADFHLSLIWQDPRLAAEGAGTRQLPLEDIWNPRVVILNQRNLSKQFPDVVQVDDKGVVFYRQRFSGKLSFRGDLSDFPLDSHVLPLWVISAGYGPEDIHLTVDTDRTGRSEQLTVSDWSIGPGETALNPLYFAPQKRTIARRGFTYKAERDPGYYFWKVLVPLALIVCMSWSVFWIDPAQLGPQVGVATASVLTLVAYQFILSGLLPRISYLTRIDYFILGSTLLVFLALVEAITTAYLAGQKDPSVARRIDRYARAIFPACFLGLILWVFLR